MARLQLWCCGARVQGMTKDKRFIGAFIGALFLGGIVVVPLIFHVQSREATDTTAAGENAGGAAEAAAEAGTKAATRPESGPMAMTRTGVNEMVTDVSYKLKGKNKEAVQPIDQPR